LRKECAGVARQNNPQKSRGKTSTLPSSEAKPPALKTAVKVDGCEAARGAQDRRSGAMRSSSVQRETGKVSVLIKKKGSKRWQKHDQAVQCKRRDKTMNNPLSPPGQTVAGSCIPRRKKFGEVRGFQGRKNGDYE